MRRRIAQFGGFLVFAVAAVGSTERAHAPIVEFSYTEFARGLWRAFEDVSSARELTPEESDFAQKAATAWFHIGPCLGNTERLDRDWGAAIGYVASARPDRPVEAAVLEMIAIMTRDGLGRDPSDNMCKFALETAVPARTVD